MQSKPNKNKVFLIGMPGAGKTFWAKELAHHMGLLAIDLDKEIEDRTGLSICDYFSHYGEDDFRKVEQRTLRQLLEEHQEGFVMACGGGTPCFFDNLTKMKALGKVLYIQATLTELAANLHEHLEERPLLKNSDWETQLLKLYDRRRSIYEQADHTFQANALKVIDFDIAF